MIQFSDYNYFTLHSEDILSLSYSTKVYPPQPVVDAAKENLTEKFSGILKIIFDYFDKDHDGVLSDAEMVWLVDDASPIE
jgi:hypothetical protein